MEWIKFEDELPTIIPAEQVDIFFTDPTWSTFFRGLYTHFPDEPLRYRLLEYKPDIDKFHEWQCMIPTHWMKCPVMPKGEELTKHTNKR